MKNRGMVFLILLFLLVGIFIFPLFFPHAKVILGINPPEGNETSFSNVTFDFKGTSNVSINSIQLFGDWTGSWVANYTNNSYENNTWLNITVEGIPEGNHTWGVLINNSEGVLNWSSNRSFTVDRTAPIFISLTNQTGFSNESFNYFVNASDGVGIGTFSLNDTSVFSINSSTGVIVNTSSLSSGGFYIYNLSVNDTLGNLNWTLFTINITLVPIEYPLNYFGTNFIDYSNLSDINLTFDLKAISNVSISTIQLFGNWTGNWTANYTNASYINDTWLNVSVGGISEGNYVWGIYSNDSEGKESWSENRTFRVDRTLPTITIVSPTANANYDDETVTFSVITSEISSCEYSLDAGSINNSMTANGNNTGFSNSKNLDNDNYDVEFYCTDSAGNLKIDSSISFDVEVVAEVVEETSPDPGETSVPLSYSVKTTENESEENESELSSESDDQENNSLTEKEISSSKIKFKNPFFKNLRNAFVDSSTFSIGINLKNLKTVNSTEIVINYTIKDLEGNVYFESSEVINSEEMKSYSKDFDVDNLPKGKYVLEAQVNNAEEIETIKSNFKVRPNLSFILALIFGLIFGSVIVFFLFNRFGDKIKNRKYLVFTKK